MEKDKDEAIMVIHPTPYIILVIHLGGININKEGACHRNWSGLNKVKDITHKISLLISRSTKKTKKNSQNS